MTKALVLIAALAACVVSTAGNAQAPAGKVGELHALLTLVGGKAVYGEGPLAAVEGKL